MPDRLRALHLANVALGNPYTGLPLPLCRDLYHRFNEVFDAIFDYIESEKIDLVLVSGNLCGRYFSSDDAAHLLRKLSETSCRFVIAPGDQDCYEAGCFYASGRLPENVTVFDSDLLDHHDFDDLGVTVYGWAIRAQRASTSPLAGASVEDPDRINLVVGSCDIGGRTLFPHVSPKEIAAFGADYAAFSHGPATSVLTAGKTKYCQAGFLEGRSFEELGIGGFHRLDITKEGVRVKFVPLSRHRYEAVTVDITGACEYSEVVERLSDALRDRDFGKDTSLRVILEGEVHPAVPLRLRPEDEQRFPFYHLDIVDRTLPTLNAEIFERDMSVRGELYRTLLPRLNTLNLQDRIAVAQALRAGLAALESRDITIL